MFWEHQKRLCNLGVTVLYKNVSEDEKSKALEEAIASGLFSSHKE